jgi:2-iminobutanoate/2-iminopropanoate deaminase
MKLALVVLLGMPLALAAQDARVVTTPPVEKKVIQLPGSLPGLPFSSAVQVGSVIYLSGQIGVLPGTRQLVDTGVVKQTQQTLENIKAVLAYAGSSMDRVFKCTVFLTRIADFEQMNGVYATYFPKDPPARSTVAGSGLALGARVEIECLALAGPS